LKIVSLKKNWETGIEKLVTSQIVVKLSFISCFGLWRIFYFFVWFLNIRG
jgi:hypothetical protein